MIDRALRNDRNSLPHSYQAPRYFVADKDGGADMSARWPGWDGWYFFVLPEDRNIPVQMIRASIMTGLYGLDGIDNYERLSRSGLTSFEAIEYLTYVLSDENEYRLTQRYLPKNKSLTMRCERLDVAAVSGEGEAALYGRIHGAWPDYEFRFSDPEAGLELDLRFRGDRIEWWADIPNIFTYFAVFGKFEGRITCKRSAALTEAGETGAANENYAVRGVGGFEHGFARKPINFDGIWLFVRGLKAVFPGFIPVRYHYELFIGDGQCQGGFMRARGFGIDFRNRGGVYLDGAYRPINSVKIEYLERLDPALSPGGSENFYRRWKVEAATDAGILEYVGTLEEPPARVAGNMMYYGFSYEGSYRGHKIGGRGYGEYLCM